MGFFYSVVSPQKMKKLSDLVVIATGASICFFFINTAMEDFLSLNIVGAIIIMPIFWALIFAAAALPMHLHNLVQSNFGIKSHFFSLAWFLLWFNLLGYLAIQLGIYKSKVDIAWNSLAHVSIIFKTSIVALSAFSFFVANELFRRHKANKSMQPTR